MKTSLSMLAVGISMLAVSFPALAFYAPPLSLKNTANVANVSVSLSNSGLNNQTGFGRRPVINSTLTGKATADSTTIVDGVNATSSMLHTNVTNRANILNVSGAVANSGLNRQTGSGNRIGTGDAYAISGASVTNVNVTGF